MSRDSTVGNKQSRKFLEGFDDDFLTCMIEELMKKDALLDLLLTNKEELFRNVKVQDLALLVELHEVPVSLFLQHVEVPLDGSTTLWHISHSSQHNVICRLAEGTFCPIIQIINEDVEQDQTQY
ncbi:mitochondrial enolase superfamily member 1 [Grus japonensis]|uniref:Mitochondrial enolase superfamily member 1 n=1 Tax=Grus japonensis TaxID=30415 RepID=A0ABC9WKF4_GRUJA